MSTARPVTSAVPSGTAYHCTVYLPVFVLPLLPPDVKDSICLALGVLNRPVRP
jgi:exoribonuclease II